MSVTLMSLVFNCNMPELKTDDGKTVPDSTAKFILLSLADHANDEGEGAYPGVKKLCKKTGFSTATVCNALNALRTSGFTVLNGKSKRATNSYTISVARIHEFQWLESTDSSGYNPSVLATKTNPSFNHTEEEEEIAARTKILSNLYEENIGAITPLMADIIRNATIDYPIISWYEAAFAVAVKNNARSWNYVDVILDSWKRNGFGWKPEKQNGSKNANDKKRLVSTKPEIIHAPENPIPVVSFEALQAARRNATQEV